MLGRVSKVALCAAVSLSAISQAQAHTTSVGYENAGPGSVTFWYGTYHSGTSFTEGSLSLVGQDVTYSSTVSFTQLTNTKPTGLVDGDTNFYSDGTQLTGTDTSGGIRAWQGVSFTGLVAGTYVFTYIPIATPTSTWQPTDNIILSSQVTLSAAVIGGGGGGSSTPPPPSVIDGSQSSFNQNDAAATGSQITFDGGVFAPTDTVTVDKDIILKTGGGVIDSTGGDLVLASTVTGEGGLTKRGSGMLTLTGANTYAGGTRIEGGVLQTTGEGAMGSGSITGDGGVLQFGYAGPLTQNLDVQSGGLTIDTQTNAVQSSGAISGSGDLIKTGTGLLNLTGQSQFAGNVFVNQGRLAVNGGLGGGLATVGDGAEIGGNGVIGGLIVRNRATAAPGNSIGKLNVATFVIFEKGSTYAVEVDAAGANDRIQVTGKATLEGGTVKVLAENGDYRPFTTYTIIDAAGGVNGAFDDVTSNLAFLSPELSYSANAVTLTLVRNDLTFAGVAQTRNQAAAGAAADQAFGYGSDVYDSLLRGTAEDARAAYDALSGEVHAAVGAAVIADGQAARGVLLSRLTSEAPQSGGQAWAQVTGRWGKTDADGNAGKVDNTVGGLMLGAEKVLGEGLRIGVAAAYSRGSLDLDARRSSAETKTAEVFVYAGGRLGPIDLRGGAGYADVSIDTDRTAVLRTVSGAPTSSRDAALTQAFIEAGHTFDAYGFALQPTVGLAALRYHASAFQEQGSSLALEGASQDHDVVVSDLGLRAARTFGQDDAVSTRFSVAWRRTLKGEDATAALAFRQGGPGFEVAAAPLDKDAVAIDAAVDWRISDRLAASAGYQGVAGEHAQDHAVQASLSFRF